MKPSDVSNHLQPYLGVREIIEEGREIEVDFGLPTRGPLSFFEHLVTLAQCGEEMGFHIISVSDYVVIPKTIDSRYPYSETGALAGQDSGACLAQSACKSLGILEEGKNSIRRQAPSYVNVG